MLYPPCCEFSLLKDGLCDVIWANSFGAAGSSAALREPSLSGDRYGTTALDEEFLGRNGVLVKRRGLYVE